MSESNYETEERTKAIQVIEEHRDALGDLLEHWAISIFVSDLLYEDYPEEHHQMKSITKMLLALDGLSVELSERGGPITDQQREALNQVMRKMAEVLPEEYQQDIMMWAKSNTLKAIIEQASHSQGKEQVKSPETPRQR